MAYDKDKELLKRLNSKSKDELIEMIQKKNKQIDRLNNKLDNSKTYINKLKQCIMVLKCSRFDMAYYTQHYFTQPDKSDKEMEQPIPLSNWR